MRLSGLARLALVAGLISAGSIGFSAYWWMKSAEDSASYQRYAASLDPGWASDADQMMLGIHAEFLKTLEGRRNASQEVYATVSTWTLWGHVVAIAAAILVWVGAGFRKSASPST